MTVRSTASFSQPPVALVDLHLHTTASDGRCTPAELVERAARASLTVMAVTDHDTTAAIDEVRGLARDKGIHLVTGIEITAVDESRDLHVLGYCLEAHDEALERFLVDQRAARIARAEAIAERLAALGVPIDVSALVAAARADGGRSLGRPQLARAMIAAGHVADVRESFDRWLATGRPAFVPRTGASPEMVIDVIHRAGGIASLAHPGKLDLTPRIPALVAAGLDALEAFHPDHDAGMVAAYVAMARRMGLLITGGSDFHGDPAHGLEPGSVTLPGEEYERLRRAHADGRQ